MAEKEEHRGRRVLMLCYYYPPIQASGTARSLSFSQNFQDLGWDPIVLTVDKPKEVWVKLKGKIPEGIRIERTSEWNLFGLARLFHSALSKLFSIFGKDLRFNYFSDLLCLPDSQIAWFSSFRGTRLARDCDVVYATCSPFSSSLSACLIKYFSGKPLVVDFRDAWALNPHACHTRIHTKLVDWMECFVLRSCDVLVVNTPGACALYQEKYPEYQEKIQAIPNGYDLLTPVAKDKYQKEPFRILHVGNFYGSRTPDLLLEALSELQMPDIEFVHIGWPFPSYERFKDAVNIRLVDQVPREEALLLMQQASLLYLKQGFERDVEHYIAVAAKTYEYLATGLPVLADCPPGDNAEVVRKYGENSFVVSSGDKEELKETILRAYEQRHAVEPQVREDFKEKFDRRNLARQLTELFEQLSAGGLKKE